MNFTPNVMFDYNLKQKRKFAYTTFIVLGLLVSLAIIYILILQKADIAFINAIKQGVLHIINNIAEKTLLGIFYASSIGGLFFVVISMEAVYFTFLKAGYHPFLIIAIYLFGIIISYSINYYLGKRLATITQKAITPKKFYKIKGIINKYGVGAIFLFNVLPLPSQPLSAILGVFKYNKAKFYTFFILGQTIKYVIITMVAIYILGV